MPNTPGDKYLDCITLGGVSTICVDQGGGQFAFVQHSTTVNRSFQLHAGDFPAKKYSRHRPWEFLDLPEYLAGLVWCSQCDEWKAPDDFGKDDRNKNGKHSHCKQCRAKHERTMYALRKESRLIHAAKTINQGRLALVT